MMKTRKNIYLFPFLFLLIVNHSFNLAAQSILSNALESTSSDSAVYWFNQFIANNQNIDIADSLWLFYGEMLYESDSTTKALDVLKRLHEKEIERLNLTIGQQKSLQEALYNCNYDLYKNRECLLHINRFKSLVLLDKNPDTLELSKATYWYGNVYRDMGFHEKAVDYYLEDINLLRAEGSPTAQSYLEGSYQNLGVCYHDRGEREQALAYYNASLKITAQNLGWESEDVLTLYNNIALVYEETNDPETALIYYDSVYMIQNKIFENELAYIPSRTHKNLGFCYWRMDSIKKARYHFDQAMRIRQHIYGEVHPKVANMHAVDGDWYFEKKEFKRAIEAFKRAFFIYDQLYETTDRDRLSQIAAIGQSLTELGEINAAESWYSLGLEALGLKNYLEKPSNKTLLTRDFPTHNGTIYLLTEIAATAFKKYQQTGSKEALDKANNYYLNLIDQLEYIRINSSNTVDKQDLIQENLEIYERAIDVAFIAYEQNEDLKDELKFANQILNIAEKSRAVLLTEHRNIALINLENTIPPSLLDKELNLRNRLNELRGNPQREASEIFAVSVAYDSLISVLQRDFPDYYALRFLGPTANLSALQKTLQADQSILEYFVGDTSLYIIHATVDEFIIKRQSLDKKIKSYLNEFQDAIVQYFTLPFASGNGIRYYDSIFTQSSDALFRILIEPIPNLRKDLIIIPHKELAFLPFELLLYEPVHIYRQQYVDYPILLDKHNISYNHTASLFIELDSTEKKASKSSIATFVPNFKNAIAYKNAHASINLGSLKSALKESFDIKKQIKGTRIFKDKRASRDNFIKQSLHHQYMHVSSHAIINDDYPNRSFIAFSNQTDTLGDQDVLFMTDIYQQDFPLDMLVLSACQTASGELHPGAGISSMSMAFAQSGVRSLITSMWPVNDQYTAAFMRSFYGNLAKGFQKDHALRASKLELKSKNVHPFYWAGFILTGTVDAIDFKANSPISMSYILFGSVLLILIPIGIKFLFQKNSNINK